MCSLLYYIQVQLSKHQSLYNGLYFSSRSRYVQPQDFNIKKIIETFDPNLSITSLQTYKWNKTYKSQKEYNWLKTKNWIGKNGDSYLESKSKPENIKNILYILYIMFFAVGV